VSVALRPAAFHGDLARGWDAAHRPVSKLSRIHGHHLDSRQSAWLHFAVRQYNRRTKAAAHSDARRFSGAVMRKKRGVC
jgi:hypothetical protein